MRRPRFWALLGGVSALALVAGACAGGPRLDAVITSVTTAQGFIDEGNPVKIVGEPVFYEPLSVAFDKGSELDGQSLLAAVSQIVQDTHADGTLTALSTEWYGYDLTVQEGEEPPAPSGATYPVCDTVDPGAGDLLADICQRGVIRVSTDPAYPPQSSLNEETGEYEGFDIDVATEIANRLGVDVEFLDVVWDVLVAGSWNDRWDMSVGSMTPTAERQEVIYFTPPYYFTPAVVVVRDDSEVQDVTTDLDGKKIGVCAACTYDFYLQKNLEIPGFTFDFVIDDAEVAGYDTDTTALADLIA